MTKEQKEKPYPSCQNLKTGEPTQRTISPRPLTETTKQPEGGQVSTRSSSTTAAKHPPETTNKQHNRDGKASIKPSELERQSIRQHNDGKVSAIVVAAPADHGNEASREHK